MEAGPAPTSLITGCGGFIGSHLAELMLNQGWTVCGTIHHSTRNITYLQGRVKLIDTDIEDPAHVRTLVFDAKPDVVFHLAGRSNIGNSWQDPVQTFQTNIFGTLNLLSAIRSSKLDPVVVVVGSSAEYGYPRNASKPIAEETPFQPGSPYAVSKMAQEMLACAYWRRYALKIIRVRPFAVIGPRKDNDAVSDFAKGIVSIARKESDHVSVGNLEAVRDFLDVRDAVRALIQLAKCGTLGEVYNLCSGNGHRLREVLDGLIALAGIPVKIVVDPKRVRGGDDAILVGDNSKLQRLGWKPQIPLSETLRDILEFWRITYERR